MSVRRPDELDHPAGASSAWSETWEFRASTLDAGLAVSLAVVRRPAVGQMSWWGAVLGRGRPLVALVEHEVAPPRVGLELRASGLWADHVCEEPHRRWSVGLEAFALALDDPVDLVTTGRGLPVALGFDLEWETPGEPESIDGGVDDGYLAAGEAHGVVQVGDQVLDLTGPGHRIHRWGYGAPFPSWWAAGTGLGVGVPPWVLSELASVHVADPSGRVCRVRLGTVGSEEDSVGPGWVSDHFAVAEA